MRPTNPLATFQFNTKTVRVVTIEGNPWFVAKDVCVVLELSLHNGSVSHHLRRLDASEITSMSDVEVTFPGPGMNHAKLISESGLYKLVMRSDKPEAKAFQDWVCKVVLPALRKDGAYVVGEEKVSSGELSEDEFLLRAFSILQRKVDRLTEERDALQQTVNAKINNVTTTTTTAAPSNLPVPTAPILHVKDGKVFANSRDVAATFGKQHFHVLRDIREITPNLDASWFIETELPDAYGRMASTYDMTRDGFVLLVMGYGGPLPRRRLSTSSPPGGLPGGVPEGHPRGRPGEGPSGPRDGHP